MNEAIDTIEIHTNVIMTTQSLKSIVENSKRMSTRNEKGHYKLDTADAVGKMISRFLLERDFESFAEDQNNYPPF